MLSFNPAETALGERIIGELHCAKALLKPKMACKTTDVISFFMFSYF